MDPCVFKPASRPSRPLSFGLPCILPNVNRTGTNYKIQERESIRFLWTQRRKNLKRIALDESKQSCQNKNQQEFVTFNTGTLVKNLYYVGNSYLVQTFKPGDKLMMVEEIVQNKYVIQHNIILLEKLISQTKSILEIGRRSKDYFIASIPHLEAERILIISEIRKEVLTSELKQISVSSVDNSFKVYNDLTIQTVNCKVIVSEKCSVPTWRYYFCILRHHTTTYGSIFIPADSEGHLVFQGPFSFQNILSDFCIKIQFYTLELENDFFMKPVKSFTFPLIKFSSEFSIDLASISLKQFSVRPVNQDKSFNRQIFESLTVKCIKTNKSFDRSLA